MKSKDNIVSELQSEGGDNKELILVELICDIRDNLGEIAKKLNYIRKIEMD